MDGSVVDRFVQILQEFIGTLQSDIPRKETFKQNKIFTNIDCLNQKLIYIIKSDSIWLNIMSSGFK